MKLTVLGAGAVGSMLGGLLQQHNPAMEVTLLVRGAHGEAVLREGAVRLVGPWGSQRVPVRAATDVADLAGSDLVLVTVKSQGTDAALAAAAPHLGKATVVSIQNGINEAAFREYVPSERLVMGMTATNMAVLEPGVVSLQLGGYTLVGPNPAHSNAEAARHAAELLKTTGLLIANHRNVLGARYNKLAINCLGYASCLSQSNFITEALCDPAWREHVGRPIVEECLETFLRAGIELAPIPGRPGVERLQRLLAMLGAPLLGPAIKLGAKQIYNRKPILFSLYQDLLRGKPTEVDFVNGHILRLAAAQERQAPYNELVVQLVHELERRGAGQFFTREEVVDHFRRRAELARRPSQHQPV